MKHILFGVEAVNTLIQGEGIDELVHSVDEGDFTLEVIEVDNCDLEAKMDKAVFWESWTFITKEHFELLKPFSKVGV
ncbi:MAG: hypothetical protein QM504_10255 [Pseudomonadota bacterium]